MAYMGTVTAINSNRVSVGIINHVNCMVDGFCKQPGIAINLFTI